MWMLLWEYGHMKLYCPGCATRLLSRRRPTKYAMLPPFNVNYDNDAARKYSGAFCQGFDSGGGRCQVKPPG